MHRNEIHMQDHRSSAPTLFRYDDQTDVRVVVIDGEPWFVLADLTRALGISQFRTDRLDDGVIQNHPIPDRLGRIQSTAIVSEPGMYEVVLRSDKPEAVAFRRWLTGTVLPEIRRTGSYNTAPALRGPELVAAALVEATQMLEQRETRIFQLEEKVTEDAPKVAYVDQFVADEDLLKLRTVASNLTVQEKWLRNLLIAKKWIYSEQTTRYSKTKGEKETITRYSAAADKKRYFRPVENHDAPRFRGEVMHTLKVTPQGAEAIARLVAKEKAA